ncbi:MAG: hypothetical protein MJ189_03220, partial [Coriobacteriales bacterium]|nr:hypothetical protein [Coriobacteriales bacterium]
YSSVDKKNGNAKIPYNEAKIFTSSKLIDFSGVVRENNDHEYTKLGGFLAFIVYAGYVGLAISAVSVIISFFLSVVSIGYLGALGGIVILTSLLSLIVYGLALVLEFRFLIKIQNRELDFIHYYIKVLCIFAIVDVIVVFLAFIIELIAGMPASYAFGGFISLFITFGCIAVVVGLTMYYFCKSVRVRTYMGTDAYAKVCPWTRNIVVAQPAISYQNSNVKPQ